MQDQREKHNKDYSQVNKETKRKLRNDQREYYDNKENEAEKTANRGEMSEVYRITRELTGNLTLVADLLGIKMEPISP